MRRFGMSFWVLMVGVAASAGQILLLSPLLPDPVASHFGWSGRADGFLSRAAFVVLHWVMIAFVSALFFGIPALLRVMPAEAVNLPHKDYWLAPERREVTFAYLSDRVMAFGAATLALLAAVMLPVYQANISGVLFVGNLPLLYVALYLVYTGIWVYGLTRRFARPS